MSTQCGLWTVFTVYGLIPLPSSFMIKKYYIIYKVSYFYVHWFVASLNSLQFYQAILSLHLILHLTVKQ